MLLSLPPELRLVIYDIFLEEHTKIIQNRQPSNAHLRLLHTCTQIASEATGILRSYLSLDQLRLLRFLDHAGTLNLDDVKTFDIANDIRVLNFKNQIVPISKLYTVIERLSSVEVIRAFPCTRGFPPLHIFPGAKISLNFELALFPSGTAPTNLRSYQFYHAPTTQTLLFQVVSPAALHTLRLSGRCFVTSADKKLGLYSLRHLTICGATGTYLDLHLDAEIAQMRLESFRYAHEDRMSFELTRTHLSSLLVRGAHSLRELVLLQCSKLTSSALSECLPALTGLEYFALGLITTTELASNFALHIPESVVVLKLSIRRARFGLSLQEQENSICDALEARFLSRPLPTQSISLYFREETLKARSSNWFQLAAFHKYRLSIGNWAKSEYI